MPHFFRVGLHFFIMMNYCYRVPKRGQIIPYLKFAVPRNQLFTGKVLIQCVGQQRPAQWAAVCSLYIGIS